AAKVGDNLFQGRQAIMPDASERRFARLKTLGDLRERKILTEEEFVAEKQKILSRPISSPNAAIALEAAPKSRPHASAAGWYGQFWTNYVNFDGRARRRDFWLSTLVNCGIIIVLAMIDARNEDGIFVPLFFLAIALPGVAIQVRRLHDIGKSGVLALIGLIPFVGIIVLLIFSCTESQRGDNMYGPNPKAE
ncbi:MAG: DUF805 domain-containing protein, partial [Planctomycetota bacterium]|nr:DUF805 domain-containing protein [Planctomycetota bacterium]